MLQPLTSILLCSTLVAASIPMRALGARKKPPQPAPVQIDRAALVLDRFSFGPRPGEIETIRASGIDAWFERQLMPELIDDSALERRLDMYPALRMAQADRMRRYPEPSVVRQMAKKGVVLPQDPEERAILTDQVEFYQMVRERQAKQKAEDAAMGGVLSTPGMLVDTAGDVAGKPAPVVRMDAGSVTAKPGASLDAKALPLEQTVDALPKPQVQAVLNTPATARYAQVLAMTPEQLVALRKGVRGQEGKLTEGMTPIEKETLLALAGTNRMMSNEVDGSRLLRDIYSERQIEAVMTDFWLNHFNVYDRKNGDMPALLPEYEATIRKHALGRFEDLLLATATSPAMMLYLDNATSVGPDSQAAQRGGKGKKGSVGLNENYARELMELHTLGVNGGYTQQDVTEVAKVFTGWTLDRPNDGGEFLYNDKRHEPGPKQVLGETIAEHGMDEGREVLHLLATSSATAHFVCLKLAQRFVSDEPPPALVDRMAATFLSAKGDVRAVLRTLYRAPEFNAASVVHAKLKTPLEYVVSAARVSGVEVQNPIPLGQALERLGMPLYGAQPPTGYKWDAGTWLSTAALVNRMNFALSLSTNRVGGTAVDWTAVLKNQAAGAKALAAGSLEEKSAKEMTLEQAILHAAASAQTRSAVMAEGSDAVAQKAAADFHGKAAAPAMKDAAVESRPHPGVRRVTQGLGATQPVSGPVPADKDAAAMAGLLLGSPEFQRR